MDTYPDIRRGIFCTKVAKIAKRSKTSNSIEAIPHANRKTTPIRRRQIDRNNTGQAREHQSISKKTLIQMISKGCKIKKRSNEQ